MKRAFILLLAPLVLFGASIISCAKVSLPETAAFGKVQNLPEVQLFMAKVNKAGNDVRPIIRQEESDASSGNLIEFYVGESHPTHNVLWNRFAVDKTTTQIFVFDAESGEYVSIEDWRNKLK
ncbi:MAG: hypothetical protein V2A66_03460 [Pseudomonadota bacterium]